MTHKTFDEFHAAAWNDHGLDAEGVSRRLPAGLALVDKAEQVPLLARLITHVEGEHLGRWKKGTSLLRELRARAEKLLTPAGEEALARYEGALRFCAGDETVLDALALSPRARLLAVAAPALAGQGKIARGAELFQEAADAASRLEKADPAHRDLAVAGNNLALALEEKPNRTPQETALMLLAARTGRREWEIAGGPVQVMRAEYRLAISHGKAGDAPAALRHAEIALELAAAHAAGDCDQFFLYEALALAERANGRLEAFAKAVERAKEVFSRLSAEDRAWCEPVLKKLCALV